jgi:hypothetical protein
LGAEKLSDEQRRDLLEIVEDRYEKRSTIVTSQIPVDHWYDMTGYSTIADAVLNRRVHNAYRIELSGESCENNETCLPRYNSGLAKPTFIGNDKLKRHSTCPASRVRNASG